FAVAVADAGTYAYITNKDDNTVSVIRIAKSRNKVVSTIPVGAEPLTVAIHPNRKRVYVTNQIDGTMSVIDARRRRVVATVPIGNDALGAADHPDGSRVHVNPFGEQSYPTFSYACLGYISVIDPDTNAVTNTVERGRNLYQLAVPPDGSRLYV